MNDLSKYFSKLDEIELLKNSLKSLMSVDNKEIKRLNKDLQSSKSIIRSLKSKRCRKKEDTYLKIKVIDDLVSSGRLKMTNYKIAEYCEISQSTIVRARESNAK